MTHKQAVSSFVTAERSGNEARNKTSYGNFGNGTIGLVKTVRRSF